MDYVFEIEMQVRDYECDIQGIVNNAIYQNYLEHARHEFLLTHGISFSQLCNEGIDAVVTRIEIDYKQSLKPRDHFCVKLRMRKEGRLRFVFDQAIFRKTDTKLILQAKVTGVLTQAGRPIAPTLLNAAFSL